MLVAENYSSLKESIPKRFSVRQYSEKHIPDDVFSEIKQFVDRLNEQFPLQKAHISTTAADFMNPLLVKFFKGVQYSIILEELKQERPNVDVEVGIVGELIFLKLTALNIGACWVGGDKIWFSQQRAKEQIKSNNPCPTVIPFGYHQVPEKHTARKTQEEVALKWNGSQQLLEAMRLAPSAINRQPWKFSGDDQRTEIVVQGAKIEESKHMTKWLDCGIAAAHAIAFGSFTKVTCDEEKIVLEK